jgi:hypothetical protein
MKKSRKMITEKAIEYPIFTRLNGRRNPLYGCSPNPSSAYKKSVSASLKEPTFLCEHEHPTYLIWVSLLRIEVCHP